MKIREIIGMLQKWSSAPGKEQEWSKAPFFSGWECYQTDGHDPHPDAKHLQKDLQIDSFLIKGKKIILVEEKHVKSLSNDQICLELYDELVAPHCDQFSEQIGFDPQTRQRAGWFRKELRVEAPHFLIFVSKDTRDFLVYDYKKLHALGEETLCALPGARLRSTTMFHPSYRTHVVYIDRADPRVKDCLVTSRV